MLDRDDGNLLVGYNESGGAELAGSCHLVVEHFEVARVPRDLAGELSHALLVNRRLRQRRCLPQQQMGGGAYLWRGMA